MTEHRPLSPFESAYFTRDARVGSVRTGGMPLYIGSTVRGRVDEELLRRALDEVVAAHPLLRSQVVVDAAGVQHFVVDDDWRPRLELRPGAEAEYFRLVNAPVDWSSGLLRAHLLRDGDRVQIVLAIHHGIADGRSAFALLDQLWRHYTAHATGAPIPSAATDQRIPEALDERMAEMVDESAVSEWVAQVRAQVAAAVPGSAPAALPYDGNADPGGRFAMVRIESTANETAALIAAARAHGISVNSLFTGAALVALREQFDAAGPLLLNCGHAADLRSRVSPPMTDSVLVNFASGIGTPVFVDDDASPVELSLRVDAGVRDALERREAAMVLLAARQVGDDPVMAAVLSAPPSFTISNIGRLPAHSLPRELAFVRDDIFAMAPDISPKLTVFTVGGRMTVQIEFDTALYSRMRQEKVRAALAATLRGITVAATAGLG
ncbi:phthiocerol/phthiodiolone dimycocerosyl transferase family protein [Nocardia cyriacigeorgica]|uniref:phthiocerol/phthiodiolone dimycocerosyl transferase family protein n=1 Tax=Nocardia cyriacigeorgica TaxID=135487 RepID=UPI0002E0BAC2|nr:condensation domain-containing protein [Nocardia cyriacigeorgica]AVH21917.1 hypothetical protein C5B73_11110 [Nocardia cyriacigeorgica]MBF6321436.1 hypothetical protein [Nocardia cyriacigeorgica]MBF6494887.1 hypothetical protein [Nocardia cyriacigeorgica]TLF57275.1 hypothetical protein FEK31_14240 [Nocardia cyriacigeorgica]